MKAKDPDAARLSTCAPPVENGNYVYMLECRDGSLYTGWTTDVAARVAAHNGETGAVKGAKCTRARRPVRLVYYEGFETKSEALKREIAIKKLDRTKKLALIAAGTVSETKEDIEMGAAAPESKRRKAVCQKGRMAGMDSGSEDGEGGTSAIE